ncbi:aspartyl/asparaginyl beta-hydroxylase domain-containing protein [Candidatus Pelagibacter sp.]|uniref:aspartyl/asparaginyl beta-hydroxylase domain-containing protein n=1 Tax=Candidatus Pelagibacter sp. TaxID=2024849 RepID=UPI003D14A97E
MVFQNNIIKIPNLKFDIEKLKQAFNQVLKIKEFDNAGGVVTNISSISLNRIKGDNQSTEGKYSWGRYWTIPDNNGQEVERADAIDEEQFNEFVPEYNDTYFKYVYDKLSKIYKLGRTRVLKKEPRSTLSWHKDPEPRLHIPIITNYGCRMVIDDRAYHMPADGSVYLTNTTKYHNFFNGGEEDRIHIVATLPNFKLFNNVNLTKETNRWAS